MVKENRVTISGPMIELLAERAAGGDAAAFAELVRLQYTLIYRIAYKWCGNQQDAEDIAQDVCIKLGQAIHTFKKQASFTSWLYRIVLNAVHDLHRARSRHDKKVTEMALVAETSNTPEVERPTIHNDLWEQVQKLPDKQRDAIFLIYSEELTHKQAGEILGCSESTVSWHIMQAKKSLKALLEDA